MDCSLSAASALQLFPAAASAVALTLKLLPGSFTAAGSLRSNVTDCFTAPNPWPRRTAGHKATHPTTNHFRVITIWLGRRRPLYLKPPGSNYFPRSEEHTSELQSLRHLV